MSKILITGATGFVGREVCRQLCNLGHTLKGTTRNSDLHVGPENIPLHYVPEISGEMNWSKAIFDVDVVIHLAALPDIFHFILQT